MKFKPQKSFSVAVIFILLIVTPLQVLATDSYPPFHIYKVSPEQSFVSYRLDDVTGKTWTSLSRRPCIFITGAWRLRYDIRKWAKFLYERYKTNTDILWIYNPSGTNFVHQYERARRQLLGFEMPVPAIIDNHSFVGRALKIDYNIPTIIGVTSKNILAFVYSSPLNKQSIKEISVLLRLKLLASSY